MFRTVCVSNNIKIEWDGYCGMGWYENYKQYKYDVVLMTPDGEQKNKISISRTLADNENVTDVSAYMRYNEKDYWGHGTDFLWIDAIADLQKHLPDGVLLKCCVACKHGSLCPVGNCENEVFCVKDIVPKEKSDLFYYTEEANEREKRSREYFALCEEFEPQSEDYYTYNDFIYFLKK